MRAAFRACKPHFIFAFGFNSLVSILLLSYPVFMIQVFDRVMSGRSWETLVALLVGLILAITAMGIFIWVRGMLLMRASARIESRLATGSSRWW